MMPPLLNIGIFCFALAAGCAGVKQVPPSVLAQSGPLLVDASLVGRGQDAAAAPEPPRSEASRETIELAPPPTPQPQPATSGGEASAKEAVAPAPATPVKSASPAKAAAPSAKAPAIIPAPPLAIEQPRKIDAPAPVAKAAEPLDVAALKERLRETNAIGMFTKLALKNQVDDLLQQFRAHYLSGQKTNVAALRQGYDMLVLKVLALIQDSDPSLARTIAGSREAIWGILADPVKFKAVN